MLAPALDHLGRPAQIYVHVAAIQRVGTRMIGDMAGQRMPASRARTGNERIVELTVGDVALVDAARPVTYVSEKGSAQWWGSLQLQRRSLLSHLGLEPRCPSRRSGAAAARPLRQLLQDGIEDEQSMSASANAYMRLAFYHLLGALFVPPDPEDASLHTDRPFARRHHQGSLCQSGLRSLRRGGRGRNLVTLPSKALYCEKLHMR
jgi:hypothetical protein